MITDHDIKTSLGLSDKESKVYYALLKEGPGYASVIAGRSGIKRSTAYQILEDMHKAGLVQKYIKGKKLFFAPAHPKQTLSYLEHKEHEIKKQKNLINQLLPELNFLYSNNHKKPTLLFYDKKSEVFDLFFEALSDEGSEEVLGFLSLDIITHEMDDRFFKRFAQAIKKQGTKLILVNYDDNENASDKTIKWVRRHFLHLPGNLVPQVKVVQADNDITTVTLMCGPKLYFIDINPPEFMGTVIVNQDMARTNRIIFNNLWKRVPSLSR